MDKVRVLKVVEDTWGHSTVYTEEPEDPNVEEIKVPVVVPTSMLISSMPVLVDPPIKYDQGREIERDSDQIVFGLHYFQASLFATVLEDTIMEVRILVECNTEMRVSKTLADMGLLLSLKYGVAQPTITDELDGIDQTRLGCVEYKLDKLDADRYYFGDVVMSTYKDLSLTRSFQELCKYVKKVVDRDNHRIMIELEEGKNRLLRRELLKQKRQQHNHIKSVTYENDVIIDGLKRQVEDAALMADIRSRYIDNWQRARTEQHLQSIEDKEASPSEVIEYFKQRSDNEQRVHGEVDLLVNIAINETLEKIEQWMNKYDKDMEAIDLKIQIKKNDYQNQLDKRVDFEKTIEKHAQMMEDWIAFKDAREKARLYREKMTNAAVAVQAWWRGLLVRRQLGPYKVSKKKKAADKDNKKK